MLCLLVATRLQFVANVAVESMGLMIADGFPFRSNEKHRVHILKFSRDLLRCVGWFLFGSVSGIINEGTHGRATINGGCHYFAKGVSVLMLRYPSRYGVRNRLTYHAVSHRVPLPVRVSLRVIE